MASENGQERRETLADIVSEIRAYGAQPPPRLMWLEIADRIEAIDSADAWRGLYTPPVGNSAAMREALVALEESGVLSNNPFVVCGQSVQKKSYEPESSWCKCCDDEIRAKCRAIWLARSALSAPARNCDLYNDDFDAEDAYEKDTGVVINDDPADYYPDHNRWLFAPAAERKGEGDGK